MRPATTSNGASSSRSGWWARTNAPESRSTPINWRRDDASTSIRSSAPGAVLRHGTARRIETIVTAAPPLLVDPSALELCDQGVHGRDRRAGGAPLADVGAPVVASLPEWRLGALAP